MRSTSITDNSCPAVETPSSPSGSSLSPHGLAILKNNEAVYHLETGDYVRAVSTLASALQFMKQALKERRTTSNNVNGQELLCDASVHAGGGVISEPSSRLGQQRGFVPLAHDGDVPMLPSNKNEDGVAAVAASVALCNTRQDQEQSYYAHQPATVDLRPTTEDDVEEGSKYMYMFGRRITQIEGNLDTAEANNELSVVIVFNLALAHHLTAVTYHPVIGSPSRLGNLRKACTLYEHGYQLTVNAQRFVDPTRAMALLNNLAICHSELNNHVHEGKCWNLLLSLVAYLTYGGCGGPASSSNNPDEQEIISGFMDNVSHLLLSTAVTSPAA